MEVQQRIVAPFGTAYRNISPGQPHPPPNLLTIVFDVSSYFDLPDALSVNRDGRDEYL